MQYPVPPYVYDEPRVPRRAHILPIESMGQTLAHLGTDLGDERACAIALSGRKFSASDIAAGLERAVDRAREIKASTDTPLTIVRDLACIAVFMAAILLWTVPAGATTPAAPTPMMVGFGAVCLFGYAIVIGALIWLCRPARRSGRS